MAASFTASESSVFTVETKQTFKYELPFFYNEECVKAYQTLYTKE